MFPELKQVHIGDLFYLRCNARGDDVSKPRWFHNNEALQMSNDEIKIQFAASKHSGTYYCEMKRRGRSDDFSISVLSKLNTPSH